MKHYAYLVVASYRGNSGGLNLRAGEICQPVCKSLDALEKAIPMGNRVITRNHCLAVRVVKINGNWVEWKPEMRLTDVIVNVTSDGGNHGPHEVQHTLVAKHADVRNFAKDWDKALEAARKSDPNEWNVTDVETQMTLRGWELTKIKQVVEVSY